MPIVCEHYIHIKYGCTTSGFISFVRNVALFSLRFVDWLEHSRQFSCVWRDFSHKLKSLPLLKSRFSAQKNGKLCQFVIQHITTNTPLRKKRRKTAIKSTLETSICIHIFFSAYIDIHRHVPWMTFTYFEMIMRNWYVCYANMYTVNHNRRTINTFFL